MTKYILGTIIKIISIIIGLVLMSFNTVNNTYEELRIERIDGCEYVKFRISNAGGVVHHEACDNPEHK